MHKVGGCLNRDMLSTACSGEYVVGTIDGQDRRIGKVARDDGSIDGAFGQRSGADDERDESEQGCKGEHIREGEVNKLESPGREAGFEAMRIQEEKTSGSLYIRTAAASPYAHVYSIPSPAAA